MGAGARVRLRRTGGTVVALGSVVLAGAAGNGSGFSAADATSADGGAPSIRVPASSVVDVTASGTEKRAVQATEASRSQSRTALTRDPEHDRRLEAGETHAHTAHAQRVAPEDPRAIARRQMAEYGWGAGEFSCLEDLWVSESDWKVHATNPTSGAYGIPQSLPAEKMASAGSDWRTNPATQIEWGLWYIDQSYGTPCSAWEFKQANNWY
ncbi:MAG: lytic transglycosylase domain-containing protein [Actinomycetota bacterium]|nr:lytic transglycosylase domain-containing protein [Actinomycetota bacterium]